MYSLVSASVLAIDLARHPSGAAVADTVDQVLALDPLPAATPAADDVRQRVREACVGELRATSALYDVTRGMRDGLPSAEQTRALATALSQALLGTLDDLLEMLRIELRAQDEDALQVALDAVTAAWAGRSADLHDLAALRAPFAAALPVVPPVLPERSWSPQLRALLDEVPHRTDEQWARSLAVHTDRSQPRWSELVHEACQAAYEADRLVEVARAQLTAARALRLSRASTSQDVQAIGMVVTGAVQAVCTSDVLDPDLTATLLRSWQAGS